MPEKFEKTSGDIGEIRDKLTKEYPEKITKIASAIETYKNMKKSFGDNESNPMIKKMMEDMKETIDSATDEDRKKAEEFIKARNQEL